MYNRNPYTCHRTTEKEMGHEMVSQVVSTGKNVTEIQVGDRIDAILCFP
ncbi:MAG: alcohol dehydrogenase catalytic domain-containing protein [Bulleidia sp.]